MSKDDNKNVVVKENDREKVIVKTSIIGIVTNIILVIFKMLVGFFTNSIAVILDAVNNLSDVVSSVITIIGTRLAGNDDSICIGIVCWSYIS